MRLIYTTSPKKSFFSTVDGLTGWKEGCYVLLFRAWSQNSHWFRNVKYFYPPLWRNAE